MLSLALEGPVPAAVDVQASAESQYPSLGLQDLQAFPATHQLPLDRLSQHPIVKAGATEESADERIAQLKAKLKKMKEAELKAEEEERREAQEEADRKAKAAADRRAAAEAERKAWAEK